MALFGLFGSFGQDDQAMERMLTTQEVADRLNCSRQHVYNLVANGDLECRRFGPRMIRVPESAVNELLAAGLDRAAG